MPWNRQLLSVPTPRQPPRLRGVQDPDWISEVTDNHSRSDFGDTKSYGLGNALTTFEAFKVYGGQIHAVEAFIDIMPANTPSGWNYEVKRPGAAAQRAPAPWESLEARLKRFEDKEEIASLLLDYGRFLDSRDFKSYSSLFAKDGEWVGGFGSVSGPANIQAFMEKNMGTAPNRANNYHLLSNFVITVTGDTATAWSRWAFVVPGQNGATISQAGRYDDTLVRENGRWKFKRRRVQRHGRAAAGTRQAVALTAPSGSATRGWRAHSVRQVGIQGRQVECRAPPPPSGGGARSHDMGIYPGRTDGVAVSVPRSIRRDAP